MLHFNNFCRCFRVNVNVVNNFFWLLQSFGCQTKIRSRDKFPVARREEHEVLGMELAIVSQFVKKKPSLNHVQENVLLSVKINFSFHLNKVAIYWVRAPVQNDVANACFFPIQLDSTYQ